MTRGLGLRGVLTAAVALAGLAAPTTVAADGFPDTEIVSGPPEGSLRGGPRAGDAYFAMSSPDRPIGYECSLDGAPFAACANPTRLTGLRDGRHTFAVRAVSEFGHQDETPARRTWTVDGTPPDAVLTVDPVFGWETAARTVTFRFTSPDPGARFSCTWDGRVIAPCASPMVVTDLSFGRHELLVFATDAAGNVDRTPAQRAFDVRPPPAPVRGRIVARWRVAKHATRVERLLVTGLLGAARVTVRGRGPGWRLRSPRLHPVEIPSLWPGPWPVVDARAALRRTKLRPGSRITIRVTEHWAIAKVATFRIRHRRPPAGGVFRCLRPGAGKPVACSP